VNSKLQERLLSVLFLTALYIGVERILGVLSGMVFRNGPSALVLGTVSGVSVALLFAWGRDAGLSHLRRFFGPKGVDIRLVVGDFAAATRESLDVETNAENFMDALENALKPRHQMLLLKGGSGEYDLFASRGLADPMAHLALGPQAEDVIIPLRVGERTILRLMLGPTDRQWFGRGIEYGSEDYALIDSLGQSLALSIRNAQLFDELASQERMRRELEIGFEVQMGLLPKILPSVPGVALAAACLPAMEVGGDLYDFIQIDATRWGFLLGDVAGKGVPAALMMAVTLTLFRAIAPGIPSPAQTLTRLNKLVYRNRPSNRYFVAAIYMIYDSRDGSVRLCNAGLPHPLVDGVACQVTGMPLGLMLKTTYQDRVIELNDGQNLVLYTDGIEDVENSQGQAFGLQRLQAHLERLRGHSPSETLDALNERLAEFGENSLPADDQTVLILQRTQIVGHSEPVHQAPIL
jgi:serine phosphatase RsbU (regulator of sigma subunit)